MTEYNIYCDESCHLEHDGEKIMVIGGIRCPKIYRKEITSDIYKIKSHYGISKYAEIKWNKVSSTNIKYFKALTKYFFDSESLEFRSIIVDKTQLKHEDFNQTHDEFYYKTYFHCLIGLVSPRDTNYIYLDKKDTRGTYRIQRLQFFLGQKTHDFNQENICRIQCVSSFDLPILQLADLLIGAIGYHNRDIPHSSAAKRELVSYIQTLSGYSLERTTFLSEKKFNMFFMDLQ